MKDKKDWIRSFFNQKPTTAKQTNTPPEAAPHSSEDVPVKDPSVPPGAVVVWRQNSSGGPQVWNAADGVPAIWNVGDLIIGEYEVISKLGEGGMGAVYKIHDRHLNADLAVKSPRPEIFTRADGKENFIREAETWVKLRRHPHLVQCFFVLTLGRIPRIFAEYVDGGSLADWIRQRKLYEGGEAVALARILDVAIQFAWGLHAAHEQGLVHQDIKPANVMLTSQGIVKVTDFGIAKARTLAGESTSSEPEGEQSPLVSWAGMTPAYCSPEQAARQELSRQTDIWSWGLSILQMFVGKVTWAVGVAARAALASHVRDDPEIPLMPPEVVKLLNRCFEPQPEKRPATMLEVATELQAIYVHRVGRAYPRKNSQLAGPNADVLMVQGIALDRLGKPQEALALYEQAIRLDPDHFAAHHNKGLALLQLGRNEEALAAYEQAILLYETGASKGKDLTRHTDSSLTNTYDQKGLVLRRLGRLEEALAAYEQAIHLDPMNGTAYNNKGNVLVNLGRREEGLNAYEQAIRLDPMNASAYNNKGDVLINLGKREEALASLEQAIRLDPIFARPYCHKGKALLQLGRHKEAQVAYEQAIRLDPKLVSDVGEAYIDQGVALRRLRRQEEALDVYEQAIRFDPKLALAHSNKGNVLLDLGRLEEALAAYEQAISLDPKLALAYSNKGNVLLKLERREEAQSFFQQAINLDPTLATPIDKILHSYKQAVHLKRTSAANYHNLAITLLQQGEPQKALALLEQAIGLDPTLANAYYYKGLALLQVRRLEEALIPLEQAIGLNSKLADAYHCKGAALSELGRQEEALTAYEQAIHLDPRLALTHFHKGLVLKQLGRRDEAQAAYEQAIDLDPTFVKYWRMML